MKLNLIEKMILNEIGSFESPIIKSRRYVIGNSQAITKKSKSYKKVWSLDAAEAPHAKRNYKPGKHYGNDIFGLIGEKVYAAISGYLHCAYVDLYQSRGGKQGKPSKGGKVVTIATNKPTSVTKEKNRKFPGGVRLVKIYPPGTKFLRYAHLDKILIKGTDEMGGGKMVTAGELIGELGATGSASTFSFKAGPYKGKKGGHIHLSISGTMAKDSAGLKKGEFSFKTDPDNPYPHIMKHAKSLDTKQDAAFKKLAKDKQKLKKDFAKNIKGTTVTDKFDGSSKKKAVAKSQKPKKKGILKRVKKAIGLGETYTVKKLTRSQLRQTINESIAASLPASGIQIIYDGFENKWDQTQWDFIINGKPMSTRAMNSTHPTDISYELSGLIGLATGKAELDPRYGSVEWHSEEEELQSDDMALNFLMGNQQFLADAKEAYRIQNMPEY